MIENLRLLDLRSVFSLMAIQQATNVTIAMNEWTWSQSLKETNILKTTQPSNSR
jgi:hypothetical protein